MILGQDIPNYAKLEAKMTETPKKQTKSQVSSKQTHRANRVLLRENPRREASETSLPQLPSRTTFPKKLSTSKQNAVSTKKIIIDTMTDYISTESRFEPHHNQTFATLEDLNKPFQEKLPIIPLALISPKEGATALKDNDVHARPSFLAPTVAALQHFKDKNLKKDASGGKGFVFSRPKDKAPKYDPLLQSQEEHGERVKRGLGNLHLHQSASAERTSSKKSSAVILRPFQKESSPRDRFESSHDSILAPKNQASSVMGKELEARWGYRRSISDIDENEEENLDEKESNQAPAENGDSPKIPLKKTFASSSQGSSLKIKSPKTSNPQSLDMYLKSAKTKSLFFSGGIREKIWANKIPKKAESTEKSPRSPATKTSKFFSTSSNFGQSSPKRIAKKDDVFQSGFGGAFFQFNQDNKFFDSFDKFHKPNDKAYLSQNGSKGTVPVMVSLGQNDRIIQPNYMKDSGSMCITEFWPKKYNVMFYYHLKDTANHIRVRKEGRENEVMYRPNQWERQDKVKRMNDSSHYIPSASIMHTQTPAAADKLDTSSISGGTANSPSKQKKRYTSLWQDSNQDSPSIVERMESYGMKQRASMRKQASSENESKLSQRSFDIRIEDPSKQPEVDLEKFKVQSNKAAVYLPRSLRHPDHDTKRGIKSRSINVSAR